MKIIKLFITIPALIFVTFFSRFIAFYFFGDSQLENEWLLIINNLSKTGVLGINVAIDEFSAIPKLAGPEDLVLPTVFMPPLYSYYIFSFKYLFSNIFNYLHFIIFSQILLSTISVYIFFKILRFDNNLNFSIFFSYIFSLIPINIYSSVQISSISIQVFLLVYLLFTLKRISLNKLNYKQIVIFSILSGLLILLRGEFILFYIFTLIYFFIFNKKKFNYLIISLMLTSLIVSPYVVRNYINFNNLILTKSFGYNLLKGNNPEFKVEGNFKYIEEKYNRKELNIKSDVNYEINLDNLYKEKAIEYIYEDPSNFFSNYTKKVFAFLFLDLNSSYKNYYNFFHLFPKLLLSFTSIIGAIIVLRRKGFLQYLSLYFFSNILFFSIFFILPRYSLIMMPIQLLLTIEICKYLQRKFLN